MRIGYRYSLDTMTGYRVSEVFKRKETIVFRKHTKAA
jgi:hypothetical protein